MKFEERYTLQVPLGESARGTVWSARDERLKRPAVVAVVETDAPEGTSPRFLEAWEPMGTARHPALPRLIERGTTEEDVPFVAMEKVEGEALAARLQDGPPLRIDHLTRAVVEVADGLAVLHKKGGAHGDVEPSNILLRERGGRLVPKVVGLGLGRAAVRTGAEPLEDEEHLPTLAYMSPGQARGQEAGPADDAYALAAVLYSSITGRLPHHGTSVEALREHAATAPVPRVADVRPELAGPVAEVVDRALSIDEAERFVDCVTLSKALRTALLKSRGLAGFTTEAGKRTLAPGPVVSKPKTMPPPRPAVSLPRPGGAKRKVSSPRPKIADRPPLVARPKGPELRPSEAPPVGSVDEELGFERLSGILEIPELDEKAGPPAFPASAKPQRSAPPPPPPSSKLSKKKPTVPPPPPSPLGLQALGAKRPQKSAATSEAKAPAEPSPASAPELEETPETPSDSAFDEAAAIFEEAASRPVAVAHEEPAGDDDDISANAGGDSSSEASDEGDEAEQSEREQSEGEQSEREQVVAGELAADDEDAGIDEAVVAEEGEASAAQDDDGSAAALLPPVDEAEDSDRAPAVAPLSFDPSPADEVLPLERGVPIWVWGAAAVALLVVLVVGGLLLGGEDEAEAVAVAADPPTRPEVPEADPAAPETPAEEPAPAPEPAPPPVEEPVEETPVVRLAGVPTGATLQLDGEVVEGDLLILDPALTSHVLRVTLEGHVPFETEWSGEPPDPLEVELEPVPAPAAEPTPVAAARRPRGRRATGRRSSGRRASGRRTSGQRSTGRRAAQGSRRGTAGRRRPVAVTDPGF